jgi:hydroxyacylglutathione hydrolase
MQRLRELAPGVLAATAEYATTTSTVVTAGDGGCLVVDPAVSAGVAALAADLAGAGLRPRGRLRELPHWDHVLWSRDLDNVPRCAAPGVVMIAETERDGMVSMLQKSGPWHDLELFGRLMPLPAGAGQSPVPLTVPSL